MATTVMKREAPGIALVGLELAILRILPFASNLYARVLRKLMDSVSDESFRNYTVYFAGMVKLTKGNSKRFRNSNKETDCVLKQYPRLPRGITLVFVKAHRRKCKLTA